MKGGSRQRAAFALSGGARAEGIAGLKGQDPGLRGGLGGCI